MFGEFTIRHDGVPSGVHTPQGGDSPFVGVADGERFPRT